MIKLAFDTAVFAGMFLAILVFLGFWLMEYYRGVGRTKEPSPSLRQCPYCSHLYEETQPGEPGKIMVCPLCKSYFGEEGQ